MKQYTQTIQVSHQLAKALTMEGVATWVEELTVQKLMERAIRDRRAFHGFLRVDVTSAEYVQLFADPVFQRLNQSLPMKWMGLPKEEMRGFLGRVVNMVVFLVDPSLPESIVVRPEPE